MCRIVVSYATFNTFRKLLFFFFILALIKLSRKVTFKPQIQPVCLPQQGVSVDEVSGQECYITGEGIYFHNPRADGAKRRARVLIPPGYLHTGKGKH